MFVFFQGVKYFECARNRGLFVSVKSVFPPHNSTQPTGTAQLRLNHEQPTISLKQRIGQVETPKPDSKKTTAPRARHEPFKATGTLSMLSRKRMSPQRRQPKAKPSRRSKKTGQMHRTRQSTKTKSQTQSKSKTSKKSQNQRRMQVASVRRKLPVSHRSRSTKRNLRTPNTHIRSVATTQSQTALNRSRDQKLLVDDLVDGPSNSRNRPRTKLSSFHSSAPKGLSHTPPRIVVGTVQHRTVPAAWSHASAEASVRDQESLFDDLIDGLGHRASAHEWSPEGSGNVWNTTSPLGSTASRDASVRANRLQHRTAPTTWSHASAETSVRDQELLFDDLMDGLDHDRNRASAHEWSPEGSEHLHDDDISTRKWFGGTHDRSKSLFVKSNARGANLEF